MIRLAGCSKTGWTGVDGGRRCCDHIPGRRRSGILARRFFRVDFPSWKIHWLKRVRDAATVVYLQGYESDTGESDPKDQSMRLVDRLCFPGLKIETWGTQFCLV